MMYQFQEAEAAVDGRQEKESGETGQRERQSLIKARRIFLIGKHSVADIEDDNIQAEERGTNNFNSTPITYK